MAYQMLVAISWLPDPGCQILDTGALVSDPGYQIPAARYPDTRSRHSDHEYHIPGCQILAARAEASGAEATRAEAARAEAARPEAARAAAAKAEADAARAEAARAEAEVAEDHFGSQNVDFSFVFIRKT